MQETCDAVSSKQVGKHDTRQSLESDVRHDVFCWIFTEKGIY